MPDDRDTRVPLERGPALSLADLEYLAEGWVLNGEVQLCSREYVSRRRDAIARLLWFLRQREYAQCGTAELRAFLAYLRTGHEDADGRWGNPRQRAPLAASTIKQYHTLLRAFFNYLVAQDALPVSPMKKLTAPLARPDQIQPFTPDQQRALLAAARASGTHARRNTAIVLFLLDTGARASEVCALRYAHVDLRERAARVLGKGGKERTVCYGAETAQALWAMGRFSERSPDAPLFPSLGSGAGQAQPLTRAGLREVVKKLGKAAKLTGARCSPHTFRHTFAVNFLRAGGDAFALQVLLGHSSPAVTARYVNLARADIQEQHRRLSPLDRVLKPPR